jgi:hypothetical protein
MASLNSRSTFKVLLFYGKMLQRMFRVNSMISEMIQFMIEMIQFMIEMIQFMIELIRFMIEMIQFMIEMIAIEYGDRRDDLGDDPIHG